MNYSTVSVAVVLLVFIFFYSKVLASEFDRFKRVFGQGKLVVFSTCEKQIVDLNFFSGNGQLRQHDFISFTSENGIGRPAL